MKRDARRPLSLRKRLVFAVAVTCVFVFLLEAVLLLCGVQTEADMRDPLVGFEGSTPLFVERAAADGPVLETAENKLAWFNRQSFPRDKASETRRIFCLGGSTTYGRPYDDTTSFAGWLRELLPRLDPAHDYEVINAGGISYASYRVAALVEELSACEPDLFIVYTGHNEFLEERTYAALRDLPDWQRGLTAAASRLRTVSLLQRLTHTSAEPATMLPGEVDALLDRSVGPKAYQRDDEQRARILAHFEFNLGRIVRLARASGAEVLLVVPACNIKDCAPFKSQHADSVNFAEQQKFAEHFRAGKRLAAAGEFAAALAKFNAAALLDDRYAALHDARGRALVALARYAEAQPAFEQAIREDVCPLRALPEMQAAVLRVAEEHDVPVVDFPALLRAACVRQYGHYLPGREFFLDHVHPTIDSHRDLALALVDELKSAGWLAASCELDDATQSEVQAAIEAKVDPAAHGVALRNLAKVLNWAGKHEEAGRLALDALDKLPDDPESLYLAAAYLRLQGQFDKAIDYFRRSLSQAPNLAEAHSLLAAALIDRGDYEEALVHFRAAARLRPGDARAAQMIGAILVEQQQHAAALTHFRRALELQPDNADAHYNLGFAHGQLDEFDEAFRHLRQAIKLNPSDAAAHYELAQLLERAGNDPAAVEHYRRALELRPDHEAARERIRFHTESTQ